MIFSSASVSLAGSIRRIACTSLLGSALLGACGPAGDADPDAGPPGAQPPYAETTLPADSPVADSASLGGASPQPRAPTRIDSISIEGMTEPISLRLVESPDGFEPAFSVYVPEGFDAEFDTDSADELRLTAAFAGRRNPNAYVQVFFYPQGTSESIARESALGFARSRHPRAGAEPIDRYEWALEQYRFQYGTPDGLMTGSLALGQHAGRYFHVLVQYPAEYGDGMGPRVPVILDSWRWRDTGQGLHR